MKFHDFQSLEEIHLEITNRCNAACPMCARNNYGGKTKGNLILNEWSALEAKKVFTPKFVNLRNLLFCGTHGDPAVAKDALQIVQIAKEQTSATVEFYSNGSVQNSDWWRDLGETLSAVKNDNYYRKTDLGVFSIDGLSDTNHIYRRKTNFEKIIENAQSFIKAGGHARWDFLVFKHNEHQVEKAQELAKKIGFNKFRVRKTSRFANSPDGPDKHRVLNNKGEVEYYLEPPSRVEYLNQFKKTIDEQVKNEVSGKGSTLRNITCLNKSEFNRMYINAKLEVYPCCFISSDLYQGTSKIFTDTKMKVIEKYGVNFNSLKNFGWDEILSHPWLNNDLVESWGEPNKKLLRCLRTCGVKSSPIISQSQDVSL